MENIRYHNMTNQCSDYDQKMYCMYLVSKVLRIMKIRLLNLLNDSNQDKPNKPLKNNLSHYVALIHGVKPNNTHP